MYLSGCICYNWVNRNTEKIMTTINRTKLLEYLDSVMDEELNLSRLNQYCSSNTSQIEVNTHATKYKD